MEPTLTYLVEANGLFKIGVTSKLDNRPSQIQTGNPHKVSVICTKVWSTREIALFIEQSLHYKFKDLRLNGEWFNLTREELLFIISLYTGQQIDTIQSSMKLPVIQKPTAIVKIVLTAENATLNDAKTWLTNKFPKLLKGGSITATDLTKSTKHKKDIWIRRYNAELFTESVDNRTTYLKLKESGL